MLQCGRRMYPLPEKDQDYIAIRSGETDQETHEKVSAQVLTA